MDYLKVHDGDSTSKAQIAKLSGQEITQSVRSSGTDMFLVFTSDKEVAGKGFKIVSHFLETGTGNYKTITK